MSVPVVASALGKIAASVAPGLGVPAYVLNFLGEQVLSYAVSYLEKPENIQKARVWLRDEIATAVAKTDNKFDDRLVQIYEKFVGLK